MTALRVVDAPPPRVIPIRNRRAPAMVPAVMRPRPVYVAVCTALGRPHYGPFTILVPEASHGRP